MKRLFNRICIPITHGLHFLRNSVTRKVFRSRIFIWVSVSMLFVVAVFAASIFYSVQSTVMKREHENNLKILNQVKYNIEMMDEIVRNLAMITYYRGETMAIMNSDGSDISAIIGYMNRIDIRALTNSIIHSISVYNNNSREYYSSFNSIYSDDRIIEEFIDTNHPIPKLKPIHRKFRRNDGSYEDLFTYFMYDQLDENKIMDGALIVNVKSKWLFDNIKMINEVDRRRGGYVFILDSKGNLVSDSSQADEHLGTILKSSYEAYAANTLLDTGDGGSFSCEINGKEYLVNSIKVDKTGWILFKTEPSAVVHQYVSRLRILIGIITGIFLLLAAVVSLSISRGIYKPIGKLLTEVRSDALLPEKSGQDEISLLSDIYKQSMGKARLYDKEKRTNADIMKTYHLRRLLMDSSQMSQEEFLATASQNGITLSPYEGLALCVVRIDAYEELNERYSGSDMELFKFAVMNVAREVLERRYKNEPFDMKGDQIVILLNTAEAHESMNSEFAVLFSEVQQFILDTFKFSISAAVSEEIQDLRLITQTYNQTMHHLKYRYVLGSMCMITPAIALRNSENMQFDHTFAVEKKLVGEIKAGNADRIEEALLDALGEIASLNYDNISMAVIHLINTVNYTIHEISQYNLVNTGIDLNAMTREFMGYETIDRLYYGLAGMLNEFVSKRKNADNGKNMAVVEAIKEIINQNYSEYGLSASQISSLLKMSPGYIGKIFNESTRMSIPEYISDVRLSNAAKLLEETQLSINEVIQKSGIDNTSYFYRLFKKKYGVTPKEYVVKKALK